MNKDEADKHFAKLLRRHRHHDARWIRKLEEYDQPPLYLRRSEVEFLRDVAESERGPLLMKWSVMALDAVRDELKRMPNSTRYSAVLRFSDWDFVREGEMFIPTPIVFVSPKAEQEIPITKARPPVSPEGKMVAA